MEKLTPYSAEFQAPMSTYEGYGIDPSLMTPAYMANFRPAYKSATQEYDNTIRDAVSAPIDGMMWGAQNFGIPLATWLLASKVLGKAGTSLGTGIGGAMGGGMGRLIGAGATKVAGPMGGAATAPVGRLLASGMGKVGGLLGGFMVPLAAASAASNMLERGTVDNYMAVKYGGAALQDNLRNVYTGEGVGGMLGTSAEKAVDIAREVNKLGVEEYRYDGRDIQEIMDLSIQSGALNDYTMLDKDQLVGAIKDTVDTIKVIQDISGDKDFQKAVDYMAKLKRAGISGPNATAQAVREISNYATIAGVSTDQLMNSAGAQGMMIFQQAGMSPMEGMRTAMKSYAGFSNAFRTGLITNPELAALGGIDGATQLVTQGAMNAATDHWSVLMGMTGAEDINDAISRYNKRGNPMDSHGDMYINRSIYSQRFMDGETAGTTVLKRLAAAVKTTYGQDEEISMERIGNIARMLNVDPQVVRAAMYENMALGDENVRNNKRGAKAAGLKEMLMRRAEAENLDLQGLDGVLSPIAWMQKAYRDVAIGTKDIGDDTATWFNTLYAKAEDFYKKGDMYSSGIATEEKDFAVMGDGEIAELKMVEDKEIVRYETDNDISNSFFGGTKKVVSTGEVDTDKGAEILRSLKELSHSDNKEIYSQVQAIFKMKEDGKDATAELLKLNKESDGAIFGENLTRLEELERLQEFKDLKLRRVKEFDIDDASTNEFRKALNITRDSAEELLTEINKSGDVKGTVDEYATRMIELSKEDDNKKRWTENGVLMDRERKDFLDLMRVAGIDNFHQLDMNNAEDELKVRRAVRDTVVPAYQTGGIEGNISEDQLLDLVMSNMPEEILKEKGGRQKAASIAAKFMENSKAYVTMYNESSSKDKIGMLREDIEKVTESVNSGPQAIEIEGMENFKKATDGLESLSETLIKQGGTVKRFEELNEKLTNVNRELGKLGGNVSLFKSGQRLGGN